MPIGDKISQNVSLTTYQYFDGSNRTLTLLNNKLPLGEKFNLSAGYGVSTNFEDKVELALEAKGSYSMKHSSVQGRIRSYHSGKGHSTQFRGSFEAKLPLSVRTSVYITPCVATSVNHDTNEWKSSINMFGGVSHKFGKNKDKSAFLEVQRDNLQDFNNNSGSNWAINAGLSINI